MAVATTSSASSAIEVSGNSSFVLSFNTVQIKIKDVKKQLASFVQSMAELQGKHAIPVTTQHQAKDHIRIISTMMDESVAMLKLLSLDIRKTYKEVRNWRDWDDFAHHNRMIDWITTIKVKNQCIVTLLQDIHGINLAVKNEINKTLLAKNTDKLDPSFTAMHSALCEREVICQGQLDDLQQYDNLLCAIETKFKRTQEELRNDFVLFEQKLKSAVAKLERN